MRKIRWSLVTALLAATVVALSAAAQQSTPAPEVLAADTAKTTTGGNNFIAPAGWKVSVKDGATIVEAPEGNSRVALIDVTAADADAAVTAAWSHYGDVKWPMIQKSEFADRDGLRASDRHASTGPRTDIAHVPRASGAP